MCPLATIYRRDIFECSRACVSIQVSVTRDDYIVTNLNVTDKVKVICLMGSGVARACAVQLGRGPNR